MTPLQLNDERRPSALNRGRWTRPHFWPDCWRVISSAGSCGLLCVLRCETRLHRPHRNSTAATGTPRPDQASSISANPPSETTTAATTTPAEPLTPPINPPPAEKRPLQDTQEPTIGDVDPGDFVKRAPVEAGKSDIPSPYPPMDMDLRAMPEQQAGSSRQWRPGGRHCAAWISHRDGSFWCRLKAGSPT